MKIEITLQEYNMRIHKIEIEANPVTIKGFEEFEFYSHLSIEGDIWVVTEKTSGMIVCRGNSESRVIEEANRMLSLVGIECVRETVAKQKRRLRNGERVDLKTYQPVKMEEKL